MSAQKSNQKSGFAKSKKDFPHVTLVFEDGKWVEAHKMTDGPSNGPDGPSNVRRAVRQAVVDKVLENKHQKVIF